VPLSREPRSPISSMRGLSLRSRYWRRLPSKRKRHRKGMNERGLAEEGTKVARGVEKKTAAPVGH